MYIRLALLLGLTAVLAAIAVSALVAPVPDPDVGDQATTPPAPRPAIGPAPARPELEPAAGRPFVLSADESGQVVALRRGAEARIEVHAGEAVAVQLGRDGPVEFAEPGTPAEFSIFGDAGAEVAIRLLEPDREIGRVALTR